MEHYMEQLIHTADGILKREGIPEDIQYVLRTLAQIWDDIDRDVVIDLSEQAQQLCKTYEIKYICDYEEDPHGRYREVYSDGSRGEWQ